MHFKKKSRLREGILNYCQKKGISIVDLYVNFPCSDSIRKQLKKMLLETDQLDIAQARKTAKEREEMR